MRIERIGLEHHRNVPFSWLEIIHATPTDLDVTSGNGLKPSDHTQQGGFATSRGSDNDDKLPITHRPINAVNDLGFAI